MMRGAGKTAFTLAELLIALVILGVIATFTIPKVVQNQRDQRYNAVVKEAASAVVQAYGLYQKDNGFSTSVTMDDFIPYLGYVKHNPPFRVDGVWGNLDIHCGGTSGCLLLSSGATIQWTFGENFSGTGTTNAIRFVVDPNGSTDQPISLTSPGKSTQFFLYYNGRLSEYSGIPDGTVTSTGSYNHMNGNTPPYFSWN
jgi:prepilin-type N-terminal cleavage/methylation domain-containing protein